ncbi:4-(cytidine 5'-diphospho)-2-C-methyl-D-erythritol kinase [Asaia sp. VD9]|uniref:4-(cytidine 5'-diphospho)-2-C-methyl-D-erythritol kinase n=1 Tax=Asaia sp. VD9 TaxID=3081235 RepID=UPI0030183168
MPTDRSLAHAKINLFLHVTGRRPDNYHELDSLAVFAETADILTLKEPLETGEGLSLTIDGPFGAGLDAGPENLVLRAAAALRAAARQAGHTASDLPDYALHLTKNLPVASGIGGGSADAAAALRLLATAWACHEIDLAPIAATLGADVPVCLAQSTQRMQGVGEILVHAPALPRCAMVLVNPGVAVPTPAVFKAWKESEADFCAPAVLPEQWDTPHAMAEVLRSTSNDLQRAAVTLFPVIAEVIERLDNTDGCLFARMSGSGATCFGLYAELEQAQRGASALRAHGWWAEAGWIQTGDDRL